MQHSCSSEAHWIDCLAARRAIPARSAPLVVGVIPGEGIGPEVIACALRVLDGVARAASIPVEIRTGGRIGKDAERYGEKALTKEITRFCEDIFDNRGAILNGPGGGRYVYNLRRHFDLFFKISPLQPARFGGDWSSLKDDLLRDVDILITRENCGGAYQGRWNERREADERRVARHLVSYHERDVVRFLHASAQLARLRRGHLTVVWKESGIPSISRLWRDCAEVVARKNSIDFQMVDVDLMAYRLIREPSAFCVVAAPNLFGDVLADLGANLLGSRGVSFSGNFSARGHAVYQTNHGAAYDLAGANRANPVGQIFALAMLLRESFGLKQVARSIENAVRSVWADGYFTADMAPRGSKVIGADEMGDRIAGRAAELVETVHLVGSVS